MYVKTSVRKTKNGQVRYLQLAHNKWDPAARRSVPKIVYSFGREDQLDKAAVRRLVASLAGLLDPGETPAAAADGELAFTESRPCGGAYVLDALWQRLGIGTILAGLTSPGRGEPGQDRPDAQPLPQRVQHVRPAAGPGLGEGQLAVRRRGRRLAGVQQPGQRCHQAADRGLVELVFPTEAVDDLRHRPPGGGVPLVVRQLQVPDLAVLGLPDRRLHIHRSRGYTVISCSEPLLVSNRVSMRFRPFYQASRPSPANSPRRYLQNP